LNSGLLHARLYSRIGAGIDPRTLGSWLPLAAGLAALYVPTLVRLFDGIWSTDAQGHGPIVLAAACWLMIRNWPRMLAAGVHGRSSAAGWPVFALALLFYVLGRSQDIILLELGSLVWVLAGIILIRHGKRALAAQWFPLFFMLFMLPLPGMVVDALTHPMKVAVSYTVDNALFALGYPIARSGVILDIGPYKLLVADACAGLQTLFTLEAMGLLYLNLVRRESIARNVALAVLIVPVAFLANVFRVAALTLITYHFGDEAGQGFMHGFAGILLFVTALILIMTIDAALHAAVRCRQRRSGASGATA